MIARRKLLVFLWAGILAVPLAAISQEPGRVWRIGCIDFGSRQSTVESGRHAALMQGLRESGYVEAGGLMSYGADNTDNFRRTGIFVDKIRKGARPGDIPFEQATRYALVINRKTANALGIKLNNELLARADKVIE